ncbi:MAG: SAM-dependent DNA methyltransferase [Dolichospermum sp. BR01]|nr:SAM-dependent DNA methyltransferase [Dolichospermum sp. BR01]
MITLKDLVQKLQIAADILRGHFPVSDYNKYLLRLLLLKHLSDVFDENNNLSLFVVTDRCHWSYLHSVNKGIGQALNIASQEIEYHNPNLEKIFTSIDFENKYHSLGSPQYEMILRQLIQHFSYLNLGYNNLAEPDILGKASEYLIEKFASDSGKDSAEFYTPNKMAQLLVNLLGLEKGMTICDPVCGFGGFFTGYVNYIKQQELNIEDISFYGQEKNLETWVIAKINLLFHNIFNCDIRWGDTIRDPQLLHGKELMLFDRVIANPPFCIGHWGDDIERFDSYYRFRYGIPPKNNGDFAFIQHILATLKNTGKAAIIVANGVLFRDGKEGSIRQRIIEEDLIEAVIGLAPNLFYHTGILTNILIFNRNKAEESKNKVLFIDASSKYQKIGRQNHLQSEHINEIVNIYHSFTDQEGYSKVVSLEEIAQNNYILNINRYVLPAKTENEKIDIKTEIMKLRELETERAKAENNMNKYLLELGVKL